MSSRASPGSAHPSTSSGSTTICRRRRPKRTRRVSPEISGPSTAAASTRSRSIDSRHRGCPTPALVQVGGVHHVAVRHPVAVPHVLAGRRALSARRPVDRITVRSDNRKRRVPGRRSRQLRTRPAFTAARVAQRLRILRPRARYRRDLAVDATVRRARGWLPRVPRSRRSWRRTCSSESFPHRNASSPP